MLISLTKSDHRDKSCEQIDARIDQYVASFVQAVQSSLPCCQKSRLAAPFATLKQPLLQRLHKTRLYAALYGRVGFQTLALEAVLEARQWPAWRLPNASA